MTNGNFYALLKDRFEKASAKPFLTPPDAPPLTYGGLDEASAKMAAALIQTGARPGDRIAVQVEKSPENVALYFGAMRAGLVYVPLNTAYTPDEIDYFLGDAAPAVFICDPAKEETLAPVATRNAVGATLTLGPDGRGSLMESVLPIDGHADIQIRHGDDLAVILYTSGTTGRSKGAMLSHNNLSSNALTLNKLWGVTEKDVLVHALPVFHIHGLFVALHTMMLSACEILFLPKFDVTEIRKALPRATMMMGVPTFYTRLLAEEDFGKKDCAHMRLFVSGSAPLTQETFNAFEARTGHRILERYGMSEAGMIASNPFKGARVAGTVGYALPGVSIRVTGEDGALLPAGEPGNVEVKGPNVFNGYWRNPEKTAEEFTADEWFKTGDIGVLAEDGRLTLAGRAKDLIIAGGYNIYPKEIEEVLDAVKGVKESAVIGVPHPDMGEGVVAVIVTETGALDDAISGALESIAKFKRPRKFFFIDALPRNTMGKVQKQLLREKYKDIFRK